MRLSISFFLFISMLVFSSVSFSQYGKPGGFNDDDDDKANSIQIDFKHIDSTEIDVKKALVHVALHYQWRIDEHKRYSMVWSYKGHVLKVDITGNVIDIVSVKSESLDPRWLPRVKKLILTQINYHVEVRRAKNLIN